MFFRPTYAVNTESGSRVPVWTPDFTYAIKESPRPGTFTEVSVDGEKRIFGANLVQIVYEFITTRERRKELGHDCAVFALACETDNPHRDTIFNRPGGKIVKITNLNFEIGHTEEPVAAPGDIVFTANEDSDDSEITKSSPHLMVRASADDGPPLYLSMLGTGGEVVLSTFQDMANFYPTQTAGTAQGLYLADYPKG